MATAAQPKKLPCSSCTGLFRSLRPLDCGHKYCPKCILEMHNRYVMLVRTSQPGAPPPGRFPCKVCGCLSQQPEEDVPAELLASLEHATIGHSSDARGTSTSGVHKSTTVGAKTTPSKDSSTAQRPQTDITEGNPGQAKLLWHYDGHKWIWSAAFLDDGSVAFISRQDLEGSGSLFKLHVRDPKGAESELPFPAQFESPEGICTRRDNIVVVDRVGNKLSKINMFRKSVGWTVDEITHHDKLVYVALSVDGSNSVISNVLWEKIVKLGRGGSVLWEHILPGDGRLGPLFDTDQQGHVILSNTKMRRVSLLSPDGHVIKEFPTQFIKRPSGVCFTSQGHVMVADWDNKTISLFTADGGFVRTVLKLGVYPNHITLHNDKYLAVCSKSNGLYVYML